MLGHSKIAHAKLAALTFAVIGLFHCAEFTESEFECELAVTRLQECCPSVDVGWEFCRYVDGGCESSDQYPAYTVAESLCVQQASCESIVEAGLCDTPEELGECQ